MKDSLLQEYRSFLTEVDELCSRLSAEHADHLRCREGCSACCTDLSVLPVEWCSIREGLNGERERLSDRLPGRQAPELGVCPFLVDRACSIYPLRPLICRTHGLPLAYRVESFAADGRRLEEEEWQLCWCGLNFTSFTPRSFEARFGADSVVNMEELNSRLLELNRRFVGSPEGRGFRLGKRLELAALLT